MNSESSDQPVAHLINAYNIIPNNRSSELITTQVLKVEDSILLLVNVSKVCQMGG